MKYLVYSQNTVASLTHYTRANKMFGGIDREFSNWSFKIQ